MPDFARIQRNVGRMIDANAPDSDVQAYLTGEGVNADQVRAAAARPGAGLDVLKAIPTGLAEGAIGIAGLPGDVANLAADAFRAGQPAPAPQAGEPTFAGLFGPTAKDRAFPSEPSRFAGSPEIKQFVENNWTGPLYQAQTPAGRYVQTIASFAPNMISPGTFARRAIGGVLAPAVLSETLGQVSEGGPYEGPARAVGGILGALGGSAGVSALDARRITTPGMSRGASHVLERAVGPGAEQRLAQLGPEAFLFEATPDTLGIAQTVATRPGEGRGQLVGAVTARQQGANARLDADLNRALGVAETPSVVESALKGQREAVAKDYGAAIAGAQRLNPEPIVKKLNRDIDVEAGAPKKVLTEIKGYLYKQQRFKDANDAWQTKSVLKTDAEELLNARQAVDDLISRTTEPNAMRLAVKYRAEIDKLMPATVKAVDARFAELMKQSEALALGQTILNTGKEATRPIELAQTMAGMTPGQKSLLRTGTRADLDRMVGTKANDVTALKLAVQSEGDWNRTKLAYIFGQDAADKIMKSVDREKAFQDAYAKLIENSQTAQRLAGSRLVEEGTTRAPVMRDLTVTGALVGGGQKLYRTLVDAAKGANRGVADDELALLLTSSGPERDAIVSVLRDTQAKRAPRQTSARDELVRALLAAHAASSRLRVRAATD